MKVGLHDLNSSGPQYILRYCSYRDDNIILHQQ